MPPGTLSGKARCALSFSRTSVLSMVVSMSTPSACIASDTRRTRREAPGAVLEIGGWRRAGRRQPPRFIDAPRTDDRRRVAASDVEIRVQAGAFAHELAPRAARPYSREMSPVFGVDLHAERALSSDVVVGTTGDSARIVGPADVAVPVTGGCAPDERRNGDTQTARRPSAEPLRLKRSGPTASMTRSRPAVAVGWKGHHTTAPTTAY